MEILGTPATPASPRVSAQEDQQLLSSPTEELAKLPGKSQSTKGLLDPSPSQRRNSQTGDPSWAASAMTPAASI